MTKILSGYMLEITKEICRTLIQEEELKKASKDKRKVTSDEYLISELKAEYDRIWIGYN